MKILTKEEEKAHYNATLKAGTVGGIAGLAVGFGAVYGAGIRYPAFRSLTLPLRAFLVTSTGTFAAIIAADRGSRGFESDRYASYKYQDESAKLREEADKLKTGSQRITAWARENRYPLVGACWVASIVGSFALVGRNPYLTGPQKLVQARVYAQGLTVAVLVASAAFELQDQKKGVGRWETIKILDPNDPEHKHLIEKRIHHERYQGEDLWRDMVEAEERKLKERHLPLTDTEAKQQAKKKNGNGKGKEEKQKKSGD